MPRFVEELGGRTFGPRWERMTDRQAEFLAALALRGGRAAVGEVAASLGRSVSELSWVRDQLIKEGDIYAPRYGQVAMAVPLFTPFVLTRYPLDRAHNADLASLDEMRQRAHAHEEHPPELPEGTHRRLSEMENRQFPREEPPPGPRR